MLGCNGVEQCGVEHQVCQFRHKLVQHGVQVWLHDVIIVERLGSLLLLGRLLTVAVLEVFHSLARSHV